MDHNVLLSHGVVPGLQQTIDVAEALAALSVVRWLSCYHGAAVLHTDSQYVLDGISFFAFP